MRKRVIAWAVSVLVVVAGLGLSGSSASRAMSPGVHFTSTDSPTWQTDGTVWALGQSNGLVVVGGTFTTVRPPDGTSGSPIAANGLAVLDAETGAPTSCRYTLTMSGSAPTIRAIATSDDGNIVYVGGSFVSINGVQVARLAALNPVDCTVLPLRVRGIDAAVHGIAVRGETVYLAGSFNNIAAQPRSKFAAVHASTGDLLPFTTDANATGRAVAVSPDGTKVAVGGDVNAINGQYTHSIGVVDAVTGANIYNYPRGFIPDTSVTKAIHADAGNLFYVANEGTGGGVFDGRLAIDWNTGEQVWRDECLGATQALVTYQDTLYSASHAHDCALNGGFQDGKRNYFLAQSAKTAELYGWDPTTNDGIGEGIGPRAMTIATGSTTGQPFLWYGGEFTRVNGHAQRGLTRFGTASLTSTPNPTIDVEATADGTIQVRFQTVVDSDDSQLTYRVYRDGSATPIWTGTAESVWWKRPQVTFVDTDVTPGRLYVYRVTASDGVHTSGLSNQVGATARTPDPTAYGAVVRTDEPDMLWQSTRSGRWVQDAGRSSSGSSLSGIATKAPAASTSSPIPGDTAGSFSYDGSSTYLWEDDYRPAPDTYTVEAWFNTTTNRGGKIIGFGNGRPMTNSGDTRLSGSYDRQIYMDNSGRLHFGVYIGHAETLGTGQSYNDGQWHHVVGTQGSDGMAFYVDGVRVGSNQVTTAQQYWGVWHVGGDNLNGWPNQPSSNFFAGLIDEAAAYPTALSAQRVAAHYNASGREADVNSAPTDDLGAATFALNPDLYWRLDETTGDTAVDSSFAGQRQGAYGAGVTLGQTGGPVPGTAIRLPGNQSGVVRTGVQGSAPAQFAVSVWFNTTTTEGGKIFGYENADAGNGSNYDRHMYMNDAGQLTFGTWVGNAAVVTTDDAYNDGQWHHAVAMIDPSGTKLYVDGVLRGSNNNSDSQAFVGHWRVGGGNVGGWPNAGSNSYFTGLVDEFAVFNRGLTTAEVQRLYVDASAPSTPSNVVAAASEGQLAITWDASTDEVGVDHYEIHRGTAADFTPGDDTLLGTSTTPSFTSSDIPAGTSWFAVVAVDAAGNRSDPSATAQLEVADTTPPSSPHDLEATATGDTVHLVWVAATDDGDIAGYRVHRGTSAGFTPSAANLVAEVESVGYDDTGLDPGEYHYLVVAVDTAGNVGPVSNPSAATVTAPDTTAPTPATDVTATVTGSTVQLSWTAATDDVGVAGYRVYRGDSADFSPAEANLLDEVTGTDYDDTSLEPGTYHYKVIAVDAAGNTSVPAASDGTTVSAPDTTAPSAPTGLTATAAGSTVQLSWTESTDDVGVDGYTIHRSTSDGFTPSADNEIGTSTTNSFVDTAVDETTTYYYKVTATDAAGNVSAASGQAAATTPEPGQQATVNPDEDAMVAQSRPTTNYGTNTQLASSTNTQSFLGFTLPQAPAGMVLRKVTLNYRTSTDPTAGSTEAHPVHLVSGTWSESEVTWNNRPTTVVTQLGTINGATETNTSYQVDLSASALQGRLGQPVTLRISPSGSDSVRLWSIDAGTESARPTLTLVFEPGAPEPDTTAPSAPADLTATASGATVNLAWSRATDNIGVVGYRVHRGATADFEPNADTMVSEGTDLAFTETDLAPGTYYYKVIAVDAAGNTSAPSAPASATVAEPEPDPPTVLAVAPDSDAPVVQTAPTTNYGTYGQLLARDTQQSFLTFTLPAAPSGTTLTSVELQVRTSTDPTAGSTATAQLDLVEGSWSESTITWNNRPTTVLAQLGTLSGATATNTTYRASCATGVIDARLGQTITIRLSNADADNLRLSSNEGPERYRPQLLLTFTPN